ncbi:unnamed protein product [Musa hybrid cultivar]
MQYVHHSHCIENQVKFCFDMYTICTCGRQDIDVSTILLLPSSISSMPLPPSLLAPLSTNMSYLLFLQKHAMKSTKELAGICSSYRLDGRIGLGWACITIRVRYRDAMELELCNLK